MALFGELVFIGFPSFSLSEPCTVGQEQLQKHNLQFLRPAVTILHCPHNDHLTFVCKDGFGSNERRIMLQCVNGVMDLPTCQKKETAQAPDSQG